jgi:hypothetical protein
MKKFLSSKRVSKPKKKTKSTLIESENEIDNKNFGQMLDMFVDALMFEPANDNNKEYLHNQYIYGSPMTLHPYLNDFNVNKLSPTEVDCCVDLCLCVGCGASEYSHLFLKSEGFRSCTSCKAVSCLQCIFQKQIGGNCYCYDCYLPEISVSKLTIENRKSHDELRLKFREMGIDVRATDDINELTDLKSIHKLIMDANNETRSIKDNISSKKQKTIHIPDPDMVSVANEADDQGTYAQNNLKRSNRRYCCCAKNCTVTSTNHKNVTFRHVPCSKQMSVH